MDFTCSVSSTTEAWLHRKLIVPECKGIRNLSRSQKREALDGIIACQSTPKKGCANRSQEGSELLSWLRDFGNLRNHKCAFLSWAAISFLYFIAP